MISYQEEEEDKSVFQFSNRYCNIDEGSWEQRIIESQAWQNTACQIGLWLQINQCKRDICAVEPSYP